MDPGRAQQAGEEASLAGLALRLFLGEGEGAAFISPFALSFVHEISDTVSVASGLDCKQSSRPVHEGPDSSVPLPLEPM